MSAKALQLTAAHVLPRKGPAHSAYTNTPGFDMTEPVVRPEPLTPLQMLLRRCQSSEPDPFSRSSESDEIHSED